MRVSTILDHIDSGHMALPEFQRGYVWNRDQVRTLMQSLYRRYPVGSLLVWATQSEGAEHRGDGALAPGVVKLLLDGQQRMTSLYGIIRGKAPAFFDGNEQTFTGLHFHLEAEEFAFYSPIKMKDDPLWVDVSALMRDGLSPLITRINESPTLQRKMGDYIARLNQIHAIKDVDLHIEEVTGPDKTIDVVVDIFNRVNSGGTKLSRGDLALAKICAEAPSARERMKEALRKWREADLHFNLDWLLRNVNTITTGEAKFAAMHSLDAASFSDGLVRAERAIDHLLNVISGRLGLDHDRVFFGRYAMPVMTRYLDQRGGRFADERERDKLLFWYLQSAMWGRFSGSTESVLDQDLKLIEGRDGALDRLIDQVRIWRGGLRVLPENFAGWSLGARFYPMLYLLTRMGQAKDWGTGLPLSGHLLGKMNRLEVHHIFPKALLYKHGYKRPEVNAIANFCFLTKDTNLQISDRSPEIYFPDVDKRHPGALASQWVPTDPQLWSVERYSEFLDARRRLLADSGNEFLTGLLHGAVIDEGEAPQEPKAARERAVQQLVVGGVDSDQEEQALLALNEWVAEQGLPQGSYLFELADEDTGEPLAVLDLAWPDGLQAEFSEPVAVLLGEGPEVLQVANERGYRHFTSVEAFQQYVRREVLAEDIEEVA